jgi:hypothetical protein
MSESKSWHFKPGNCMNPKGRTGSTKQQWWNKMLAGREDKILEKAIILAQNGDRRMMELILKRCAPAKKTEDTVKIEFKGTTFREQAEEVQQMLIDEKLNITQASNLMNMLTAKMKGIESAEIMQRLDKLEGKT